MTNELKDIAQRLSGYGEETDWVINSASKRPDGGWDLIVYPSNKDKPKDTKEATNDNN